MSTSSVSRRAFLETVAATSAFGLVASLSDGWILRAQDAAGAPFVPNVFCSIDAAGLVSVNVHRSEMGQGIRATMAAALADELGAAWERVRIVQGDGDPKYGDQNTDGSRSVVNCLRTMREMGAAARTMLETAAANKWGVPAGDVITKAHQVVHEASGRSLGFGELAAAARALPVPPTEKLSLRPLSSLPHLGKKIPLRDGQAMTTGAAVYALDVVKPGMKFAVVARPPVYGGTVRTLDSTAAEQTPGVERIVRLPGAATPTAFKPLGGVAVIARNTWSAIQGRDKLSITWDEGPNAKYESTAYRKQIEESARRPGRAVRNLGDAQHTLASAATRVEADYYAPHLAHATMEPPAAVAVVADGTCEVWAATQDPQTARREVASALGLDEKQVTVHVTFLGGGFGRKSKPDFVVEAALLSREIGAPVKVLWTREDEIRHGYYHTVTAQHLEAGLDSSGSVTAWLHRSAFPPIGSTFDASNKAGSDGEMALGASDVAWNVPNIRVEACDAPAHVRIGWYRSVSNIPHAFAVCSFADELAHAAGRDPRDFLFALLGTARHVDLDAQGVKDWNYGKKAGEYPLDTARMRKVLELATARARWGRSMPKGQGLGVAVHRSFLTYVASVIEVAVDASGRLSVPRVWMAVDCGFAANPDRVRSQMEGSAVMGLGNAIFGEVTFAGGRARQSNYDDYRILPIGMAPREIDVQIVQSEALPGGVGEPGVPPIAPALCNAIFAATGKRIRALPTGDVVS
jgi:isoquinoline 1-oxidoreductase beta subunit